MASSLRKDQRIANQPVQSLVIARTRQSHDQIHQDARHGKEIEKQIDRSRILTCGDDEGGSDRCGGVRALPADPAQGLALMEFFSGIGYVIVTNEILFCDRAASAIILISCLNVTLIFSFRVSRSAAVACA